MSVIPAPYRVRGKLHQEFRVHEDLAHVRADESNPYESQLYSDFQPAARQSGWCAHSLHQLSYICLCEFGKFRIICDLYNPPEIRNCIRFSA